MVSPRKSRRKSACFSSTSTDTPARARSRPSIMPAGPPPAMQHRTVLDAEAMPPRCYTPPAREPGTRGERRQFRLGFWNDQPERIAGQSISRRRRAARRARGRIRRGAGLRPSRPHRRAQPARLRREGAHRQSRRRVRRAGARRGLRGGLDRHRGGRRRGVRAAARRGHPDRLRRGDRAHAAGGQRHRVRLGLQPGVRPHPPARDDRRAAGGPAHGRDHRAQSLSRRRTGSGPAWAWRPTAAAGPSSGCSGWPTAWACSARARSR